MWNIDWSKIGEELSYNPDSPMIFNSGIFLFLFLGFSIIYWKLRKADTLRLLFVLLFSYYFYYKSSGIYFIILALVTISDYYIAKAIELDRENNRDLGQDRHTWTQRFLLFFSLVIDLGFLCFFKYTNFFGELAASFSGGQFRPLDIFLPVGISFFTFQSLSYTIDVYRGQLKALNSLLDYAFFVSFFPQLVAGPIVRAKDFIPQIRRPLCVTDEMFGNGVFFIISGLFKKAVISDYISVNFVERVFAQPDLYSGFENLMAVYGYALQIYCDFSGYSDMAIGIALLLGFKFPMNFDSPYKSASITEFWRRWHISLSSWLKDYLYISLGGNRHGKIRQYLNLIITMLLGGLWHGASLNFVAWGGLHGVALALDKIKNTLLKRPKDYKSHGMTRVIETVITFHFVCFCWIFFRNSTFEGSWTMISQIFTNFSPQIAGEWVTSYWAVGSLMLLGYLLHFTPSSWTGKFKWLVSRTPLPIQALMIVIVIFIVIQIKSSDIQPFIYFQF